MTAKFRPRLSGRVWAYIGAVLGGGVSIAANVEHSYVPPGDASNDWSPQTGAVFGAVFWPVALLVVIEILARNTWPTGGRWKAVRFAGLVPVAIVAAVVSYRHMSGLLAFYREDDLTATIGPLAVDGLMVMATGALIATSGQRVTEAVDIPAAVAADTDPGSVTVETSPAPVTEPASAVDTAGDITPAPQPAARRTRRTAARRTTKRTAKPAEKVDNAAAITATRVQFPQWTHGQIAEHLGVSTKTVSRHLNAVDITQDTKPINGTPVATGGN